MSGTVEKAELGYILRDHDANGLAEKEKLITEDDRKKGEDKIQKLTDTWTAKVEEVGKKKEQEIMQI